MMKKYNFLTVNLWIALAIGALYCSSKIESSEPKMTTYTKYFVQKPGEHWSYPLTHRQRNFWQSPTSPFFNDSIPKDYIIDPKDTRTFGGSGHIITDVRAFKEKTSGEHEAYEQFIEGYTTDEDFKETMQTRKLFDFQRNKEEPDRERLNREVKMLTNQKYENKGIYQTIRNWFRSWMYPVEHTGKPNVTAIYNINYDKFSFPNPHITITKPVKEVPIQTQE